MLVMMNASGVGAGAIIGLVELLIIMGLIGISGIRGR
jgi:hypothetical protein